MNLLDMIKKHVPLRRVSSTNGGEYHGPCPACGGKDRFHVWPAQNDGRGSYWCRQCGKWGDDIQFLRDFEGMSYQDACQYLDRDPSLESYHRRSYAPKVETRPDFEPRETDVTASVWQKRAEKLVAQAHEEIWRQPAALEWLEKRGITADMVTRYRLGWNIGEKGRDMYRARSAWGLPEQVKKDGRAKALWIPCGLVIPSFVMGTLARIRIRREENEGPRYYILPGSSAAMMVLEPDRKGFVVVEAELDAMLCAGSHPLVGSVALGSASIKPDRMAYRVLQEGSGILVGIDFDEAGAKAMQWWLGEFRQAVRWPVPRGKDPGEAYALGVDIGEWISEGLPPVFKMGQIRKDRNVEKETGDGLQIVHINPKIIDALSPAIRELHDLLQQNPRVVIINSPKKMTILRDGKFVGGRISELVFRVPEVTDYVLSHPAEEITGENLLI